LGSFLGDSEITNLVWLEVIRHIKHGVLEPGSVVEMVELRNNVIWALFELARRMVIEFDGVVEAR
jgi:hypothetical protein